MPGKWVAVSGLGLWALVRLAVNSGSDDDAPDPAAHSEPLPDAPELLAWLIIRDGEQAGSQYRLFRRSNIGRHPANDIAIADSAMSAVHATVVWENGRFVIYDLQSTNGVYVKEPDAHHWRRVQSTVLQDTMQIKLGRTVLHMMIVAPT